MVALVAEVTVAAWALRVTADAGTDRIVAASKRRLRLMIGGRPPRDEEMERGIIAVPNRRISMAICAGFFLP
ncbi:hypothetical protein AA103196_1709 [Ameyamaea chiangmaiensis NBRC 103196]|nr:hypothetical protein AA103196_1709 [Ameyamaea chiangmaiensis NBRC 103196]